MQRSPIRRLMKVMVLMLSGSTILGACNGPLAQEFRSVAAGGLQEGITAIATSVIDGAFAVFTPNS